MYRWNSIVTETAAEPEGNNETRFYLFRSTFRIERFHSREIERHVAIKISIRPSQVASPAAAIDSRSKLERASYVSRFRAPQMPDCLFSASAQARNLEISSALLPGGAFGCGGAVATIAGGGCIPTPDSGGYGAWYFRLLILLLPAYPRPSCEQSKRNRQGQTDGLSMNCVRFRKSWKGGKMKAGGERKVAVLQ